MVVRSYVRVPTVRVPVPVAVSRKLGCGADAASALGTTLHDASAFLAGAGLPATINFCNSVMLILSAASPKVSRGAWKLATLRLPLAFVDPSDATRFVMLSEFWVNCRLAFLMFSG